jgi:peroxiredoxin
MAKTPSQMVELGTKAAEFTLVNTVDNSLVNLSAYSKDKPATLIMFICNHCPFVVHVKQELGRLGHDYNNKIAILAISSNDVVQYPADAPDKMQEFARTNEFTFPYLYDEDQSVAKAYKAACTPDFFLYDKDLKLAYRGQLDDSRPGNQEPVTGKDLRRAIDALLAGAEVSKDQKASLGCNIKWKS